MCLEMAVPTTYCHLTGLLRAGDVTGVGETKGLNHLSFLDLPQTMGSRGTKVCYQQPPLCCPGLTSQMDQDFPDEVDNIQKTDLT